MQAVLDLQLRFDVETKNVATYAVAVERRTPLRFDVETKNVATLHRLRIYCQKLRFDVETKNVATTMKNDAVVKRCGLM